GGAGGRAGDGEAAGRRGPAAQPRAGAAPAVRAAEMRAGGPERVAQEIGERDARLHGPLVGPAVDVQGDGMVAHARSIAMDMPARRAASVSARRVITSAR